MLLLGLLLIALGVVLALAGLFGTEISGSDIEVIGIEVSPVALFLLGLGAGVALMLGLSVARWGARRELRQRKERKEMGELSEKLDRADAGRRRDLDEDRP